MSPKRSRPKRANKPSKSRLVATSDGRRISDAIRSSLGTAKFSVRTERGVMVFRVRSSAAAAEAVRRELTGDDRKSNGSHAGPEASLEQRLEQAGLLGSLASGVKDLATNKAHMEGFGRG